ncbi:thaumatin [Mycena rebaudengoi]|nr:thaumatin [Mycena rebaudengoi]
MKLSNALTVALIPAAAPEPSRLEKITQISVVRNECSFTIWPAVFTSSGAQPTQPAGWESAPFTNVSFTVSNTWGRRNCDFSKGSGPNSCLTGGCNGGLVCDSVAGTAAPPVTLAEWFLGNNLQDFYDVSLVDGFNLPVRIDNNAGCTVPSCSVDLSPNCPVAQKGPFDSTGFPVGCKSACTVDLLNGNGENSSNCCTGTHGTPSTCPASGVINYAYFKNNCPKAIAFVYDDTNAQPLSCQTSKNADYTLTFCP